MTEAINYIEVVLSYEDGNQLYECESIEEAASLINSVLYGKDSKALSYELVSPIVIR